LNFFGKVYPSKNFYNFNEHTLAQTYFFKKDKIIIVKLKMDVNNDKNKILKLNSIRDGSYYNSRYHVA